MGTIEVKRVLPYLLSAVLLLLLFFQCEQGRQLASLSEANAEALTDTVKHYENKLGTVTASKKVLQLNNAQLKNIVLDKDKELATLAKEFSDVKNVYKFKSEFVFEPIEIAFDTPISLSADSTGRFVRSGTYSKKWFSLDYEINNEGISIDSLRTHTETTLISGIKRKWFMGKQTVATDITNTNPHIKITGITAAEVVVPTPVWRKWYVWLGVGFITGLSIK